MKIDEQVLSAFKQPRPRHESIDYRLPGSATEAEPAAEEPHLG
ncbi:hypothetical protein [Brevibacterium atlanticum]|nr:hypothetical protein [Brevibacterium atlanticum]